MKISETIEAHLSKAVAAISQRNQATLPGHLIFNFPIFKIFNRLAKASGFCLYFYRSFDVLRLLRMTRSRINVMPDLITIATCSLLLSGYDPRQRGGHLTQSFYSTRAIYD